MDRPRLQRARWPLVLALGCVSLALLLICALTTVGVQQQQLPLPAFWLRVGPLAFQSCSPQREAPTQWGCVDSAGRMQSPHAVWLILYSPLGEGDSYQLMSISP
jgi:hypothetical protein